MRRRGVVFKSFRDITKEDNALTALSKLNENMKLVLELLADLRVNTSEDPKTLEGEGRSDRKTRDRK
jgi:hypothetical protein